MLQDKDDKVLDEFDDEFDTDGLDVDNIEENNVINVDDTVEVSKSSTKEKVDDVSETTKEEIVGRGKDKKPRKRRWRKKPTIKTTMEDVNPVNKVVNKVTSRVTNQTQTVVDGINTVAQAYDEIKGLANNLINKLDMFSKKVTDIKDAIKKIIE